MKVVVTCSDVPESAVTILKDSNLEVVINEDNTREALLKALPGAHAVYLASKITIDEEILKAAGSNLKIVGCMSSGVDHVNKELLKRHKIQLSNTSGIPNSAVADIAILLCLAASRRLHEGRLHIENGTWIYGNQWMLGQDINQSVVGIVGLGGIGQCIAKKLKAFNVKQILYCGHKEKDEAKLLEAEFVSFDRVLCQSDFVIVSCPLTAETAELFNSVSFNKMKKTAVFVNVARGGIVNQLDLFDALRKNIIFAAGLDVTDPEPLPKDHELLKLPNCVMIPHLGSATLATRTTMAELTARDIIAGLKGESLISPVI
ncbi:hypothetical protein ILUMI_25610 [Ignelater luminosus]|uniref:Glyoxylate reductase/hydroxypyruvate reductase n=1 Tax=Ignelater luminosus TaxID=2038154 RepID=A0A8K0FXT2_IGNLU|nr:hypothetical protein ILUMI_25610 [Ignelater luminosus]